eukprot:gene2865-15985_t
MPIGKVKVHNVRGGAEVKGPSNAFAKLSALGGASTKQQALDEQQARCRGSDARIGGSTCPISHLAPCTSHLTFNIQLPFCPPFRSPSFSSSTTESAAENALSFLGGGLAGQSFAARDIARMVIEALAAKYDQLVKLQEGDDAVPEAAVIWAMRAAAKKLTFEPILSDPRVLIEIGGPATTTAMLADLPVAKGSDGEGSEAVTIDFELLGIADTGESKDDDGEVDLSWLTQVTADKALAQAKTDFFQLVIHHIRLAVDTTTPKRLKQPESAAADAASAAASWACVGVSAAA